MSGSELILPATPEDRDALAKTSDVVTVRLSRNLIGKPSLLFQRVLARVAAEKRVLVLEFSEVHNISDEWIALFERIAAETTITCRNVRTHLQTRLNKLTTSGGTPSEALR